MSDRVIITERMPEGMPQWVDDAMAAGTLFSEIKTRYLTEDLLFQQRRRCRDEVRGVCSDRMLDYATTDELEDACLNAVGNRESNEYYD